MGDQFGDRHREPDNVKPALLLQTRIPELPKHTPFKATEFETAEGFRAAPSDLTVLSEDKNVRVPWICYAESLLPQCLVLVCDDRAISNIWRHFPAECGFDDPAQQSGGVLQLDHRGTCDGRIPAVVAIEMLVPDSGILTAALAE